MGADASKIAAERAVQVCFFMIDEPKFCVRSVYLQIDSVWKRQDDVCSVL